MDNSNFDEPDPNLLIGLVFVDFQGEALVGHQSTIVASGHHKASVMRSVAQAPAFVQLESEDNLTGVERVAGFGNYRFMSCGK